MPRFETVLIEARGGHYEVVMGEDVLLRVPRSLFESYEAEAVFPPQWKTLREEHPVRRLYWNPSTSEFLMAGLEAHPARTAEAHGGTGYRSFLQGVWIPAPPALLLRPHWNPEDPYDAFDEEARSASLTAQIRFLELLSRLRPPTGWCAMLNVTEPYLEALGVSAQGPPGEPGALREVSLAPPAELADPKVDAAFRRLALDHVGSLVPVLRPGRALLGVHALTLDGLHQAQALLDEAGLSHQTGPYRPH